MIKDNQQTAFQLNRRQKWSRCAGPLYSEHSDGETRPAPDEGAKLIQAFLKIADPKIRALIVELTEAFTETKK